MNFRNMGLDGKDDAATAAAMGLARQSSIYSLTLEELQHTLGGLGKDFGSMNMDEFLKNIWIAEEQATATAVGFGMASGGPGLQRQGSLTLPRTISLKTVDEVWRGIASDGNGDTSGGQWSSAPGNFLPPPQQATYGEMTLEEFLVKAGVVREDAAQCSQAAADGGVGDDGGGADVLFGGFPVAGCSSNAGLGLGFNPGGRSNGGGAVIKINMDEACASSHVDQLQSSYNTPVQLMNGGEVGDRKGVANGTFGAGDLAVESGIGLKGGCGSKATMGGSPPSNDDLSSLSPSSCVFSKGSGRKAGTVEKAVERRQKRMIKNRESAARSRARKQAYTMELEAEVAKLKEKNQELMTKQAKILEIQRQQILESRDKQGGLPKKQRLRRTQTGPW